MSDTAQVNIVKVGAILPHPNADKLQLTMVGGYQVVIGKDTFKEGDLAVYIQPDSVVPQTPPFKFVWAEYLKRPEMCQHTAPEGQSVRVVDGDHEFCLRCHATLINGETALPEKRRRITVKRLRKEYSEGLLMPLSDFPEIYAQCGGYEGNDVASIIGVTRYVPEFDAESTTADTAAMPKRRYPKTLKGWVYFILYRLGFKSARKNLALEVNFHFPEYDVNAFKNARRTTFEDGEEVTITEKIHGSNARFVFIADDDKSNVPNPTGTMYAGSHYQWKQRGDNVWWNAIAQHPFIEEWCYRHPGQVLYAEVGPTQKGYRYGCGDGEVFCFPFDVYDGDKNWQWPGNVGVENTVPILYAGPWSKDLIDKFVDGPSVIKGANTLREGIVIHSRERRLKLKVVSNKFYEGDSK